MAQPSVTETEESPKSPEYHSLSGDEPDDGEDNEETEVEIPVHPLPSMQGAFEESILEAGDESETGISSDTTDAQARRQRLLESKQYDDSWTARWKQKQVAQHHPLLKLMAQIVFGMHLLQQQQAKSEEEVVKILQSHVNEVDTFLERTSEDFDLAIRDIEDRMRYLKLPMTHLDVFKVMLEDKKFRTQLLDGNVKIERIIQRTTKARNAALLDVRKGVEAAKELGKYMDGVKDSWPQDKNGITEVYEAMRGNEQGWNTYSEDLQTKGSNLGQTLAQLSEVIGEMSKMAAEASKRSKAKNQAAATGAKSAPSSPGLRSKFANEAKPPVPSVSRDLNKPLPKAPTAAVVAAVTTSSKVQPAPLAEKDEQRRQSPELSPPSRPFVSANGVPQRPKTAGGVPSKQAREARGANERSDTAELASFFKKSEPPSSNQPNPLRSNPPYKSVQTRQMEAIQAKFGRSFTQQPDSNLTALPSVKGGALPPFAPRTSSQDITALPSVNGTSSQAFPARSSSQSATATPSVNGASSQTFQPRSSSQGAIDIMTSAHGRVAAAERNQSQPTSQKPVVDVDSDPKEKQEVMQKTGFARRLSKRMKHLPSPEEEAALRAGTASPPSTTTAPRPGTSGINVPENSPYIRATDSAYSSGPSSPPKADRPTSTVGPLAFGSSSQAHARQPSSPKQRYAKPPDHPGVASSVRSIASTSKSRGSLTKLFKLKWRGSSEKVLAA